MLAVAVTGHRPSKLGNEWDGTGPFSRRIKKWLTTQIVALKPGLAITGMALGVDQLFADVAIELGIPFIAAVPCVGQSSVWPKARQTRYFDILAKSSEIYYVSDKPYTPDCMQMRNIWMVDHCDTLLAVWDGSPGGTANCVKYAQQLVRTVLRFNPKED